MLENFVTAVVTERVLSGAKNTLLTFMTLVTLQPTTILLPLVFQSKF